MGGESREGLQLQLQLRRCRHCNGLSATFKGCNAHGRPRTVNEHTCGSGVCALLRPHLQQEHLVVAGLQERPGHIQRVGGAQERPVPALRRSWARLSGFEGCRSVEAWMTAQMASLSPVPSREPQPQPQPIGFRQWDSGDLLAEAARGQNAARMGMRALRSTSTWSPSSPHRSETVGCSASLHCVGS